MSTTDKADVQFDDAPQKATPASVWRAPREIGELVKFPSGKVARIRPLSTTALVEMQAIPNFLLAEAMASLSDAQPSKWNVTNHEQLSDLANFQNTVAKAMFIEPEVVDKKPMEDWQISVDDVEPGDKVFLTRLINVPAAYLSRFRPTTQSDVDAMATEQNNQSAAEQDHADKEVVSN